MALHSLAEGGWVNHKNHNTLQHLWNRGLIEADPEIHFTNRDFAQFVKGEVSEPELKSWRMHATSGLWGTFRTTLIVLLVGGLAALFFFSQRDILSIVTGVAGALTAATKIVSDLRGTRADGGKAGTKEA
jgi:hypothetical protein